VSSWRSTGRVLALRSDLVAVRLGTSKALDYRSMVQSSKESDFALSLP